MNTVQGNYKNSKTETQKCTLLKGTMKTKLSGKISYNQYQPSLIITPPSHLHSFKKMHTVQGDYKTQKMKTQH